MKPLLIGLSGKSGSGKSTAADYLTLGYGYQQFAFADALKDAAGVAFGFSEEQLDGVLKEVIDTRWGVSPRWCMQWLGTEILRSRWPDIWIRHLRQDILDFLSLNGQKPVVVTDVRFRDEAEALKRWGAVLVRIEQGEEHRLQNCATGMPGHSSETDLDDYGRLEGWDYVILNQGTEKQLFKYLDAIIDAAADKAAVVSAAG